ncbi:MAG TPA: Gfo/Idh/MocA family oxidoreductase [Bryobacteraceae bacterium]|nr:Gfo/Idh/MocA family oxidoreductase [Bryobacteraceae bacterium]
MQRVRMAVVGAGEFGRRHMRVIRELPGAELAAVADIDAGRARSAAEEHGCQALPDLAALAGRVDAAVVAVPTTAHVDVACALIEAGIDVLVEKPIAGDLASARRLVEAARLRGRVLQVGHLERFNPAVTALAGVVTLPLFFEVHRLSTFTPRSLDVDVVLDLMIHDIDVVLSLTGMMPEEIRAAGISILTRKVDIANVRLAFPNGCIANLTASRVSTERVRKLRLFQPHQYLSADYSKQELFSIAVTEDHRVSSKPVAVVSGEPLRLELESFLESVQSRSEPKVGGRDACRALEVALAIAARIEEHSRVVARSLNPVGKV